MGTLHADRALGQTTPITNNHYAVEFFQGPLLAPANVEGLGGATSAVATGVNGGTVNAAAPAVREPFSVHWVDVDVDASVSFPGAFTKTDYDNHGSGASDLVNDFLYAEVGVQVQLGNMGLSAIGELLRYSVAGRGGLDVTAGRYHVLGAYGLQDGQIVVGTGFRAVTMQLSQGSGITGILDPTGASLTMSGLAPEAGVIVKPNDLPFRLGVTVRAPVNGSDLGAGQTTTDAHGVVRSGGVIIPDAITLPWEVEAGFAMQVGPRPLNPRWIDPHEEEAPLRQAIRAARELRAAERDRALAAMTPEECARRDPELAQAEAAIERIEDQRLALETSRLEAERKARYLNWPRERILVVASALVTGPSSNAIALEDFFEQQHEAYGDHATVSPRVGLEAEPFVSHLKARIGSYLEPSRFDGVAARPHVTGGLDVKIAQWDAFGLFPGQIWRITGVADVAARYADWGLSVGAWH